MVFCPQEPDTLSAAAVSAVKAKVVTAPAEEVFLPEQRAVPQGVADVIRHFAGVQVKDYGGAGGLKTVNVRSLGSEHVGIFVDGIQVDNTQNMQVDLSRFSTDGLGQVSLYNAQKTSRLQTAKEYAAGAAVHLDSQRPLADGGKARLALGTLGSVNPSVCVDKSLGRTMLRAGAEFLYSAGRYRYPYFDTTLVRENSDIRSLRLDARLFGTTRGGDWMLRLYSYGSERGFPGPVIRRASGFPLSAERQADQDFFTQGAWTQEWSDRLSSAVRFKYANNYTHYNTHPERNPMAIPYNLHYRQQSGYLSLSGSVLLSDRWSVDMSGDVQHCALESDAGQFVRPHRTEFTGALASRAVWERFRIAANLVWQGAWDRYDAKGAGGWSREDGRRSAWMPSLNIFWQALDWLSLTAFVRRSYRLPSFNDLYYTQMGNASLVPESAVQTGIDLRAGQTLGPWKWELRISPYYSNIDDKIVAIPTVSQFRWTMLNIGKVDVTGLDARAGGAFAADGWECSLTLRYSLQQALDHSTPGNLTWGNQIPYIPLHSGSASAHAAWRGWSLRWDTSAVGERWSRSANTTDYRLPPWSVSDTYLMRTLTFGGLKMDAGISVRNIFNCRYQIVQGYPMPGTTVMGQLEFSW